MTSPSATTWKLYGPDANGVYGGMNGVGGFEGVGPSPGVFVLVVADTGGNLLAEYTTNGLSWYPSRVTGYGAAPGYRPLPLGGGANVQRASAWRGRWSDITGYTWLGGNYYDPATGQFLSFDPRGHASSPSGYSFCGGDPINNVDPDGRCSQSQQNGSSSANGGNVDPSNPLRPNNVWNAINGQSTAGNWLRGNVPLVGGMLGDVGDITLGVVNTALGLVSFGQSGTLGAGLTEIGAGTVGIVQIGTMEAGAVAMGAVGKVYVTAWNTANLLTGGQLAMPDNSGLNVHGQPIPESQPTGWKYAVTSFLKDPLIPEYGFALGPNWGTTQWGPQGPALNQADYDSWLHDQNLADRNWVKNQWSAPPAGTVPDGPIAAGIVLYGTLPFWLNNGPH